MRTVTVRVMDGRHFGKGVRYAKQAGGRYNPASKTWEIPADTYVGLNPRNYYLVPVAADPRCPHSTRDQGCPLHGELCAEARD